MPGDNADADTMAQSDGDKVRFTPNAFLDAFRLDQTFLVFCRRIAVEGDPRAYLAGEVLAGAVI